MSDHGALAEMLVNRVRKNQRKLAAWRKREGVSCYRIYDRDIPEIPLTIDWYAGRLHAAEWARKRDYDDPEAAAQRNAWLVRNLGEALGCEPGAVYLKARQRQRGAEQYRRAGRRYDPDKEARREAVEEGGLRFWVNLRDYVDTGLFLDHRTTRGMVRDAAPGKRVLNLFAYTGSFTVYAAAGGAAQTTTVDLSQTYLDWATENLRLNGLDGLDHSFVRADTREFLVDARNRGRTWDLVICDPPTFSNSKRTDSVFDVGRDQTPLLRTIRSVLSPDGQVVFSTNFKKFKLDEATFTGYEVEEISDRTVPQDFRDRRIHRCWWARRQG